MVDPDDDNPHNYRPIFTGALVAALLATGILTLGLIIWAINNN